MRLHLYLEATSTLPFDYLPTLKSAFHRWAGHNEALHDGLSLYSYAWLRGGRAGRGGAGGKGRADHRRGVAAAAGPPRVKAWG